MVKKSHMEREAPDEQKTGRNEGIKKTSTEQGNSSTLPEEN